jgi:hypothetical protein
MAQGGTSGAELGFRNLDTEDGVNTCRMIEAGA